MYKLLLTLFLFIGNKADAQLQKTTIPEVKLGTIEGKKIVFNVQKEVCVIVFLSPGCPLSQKYTLTLNKLAKEFQDKVKFYGVFAEVDPDLEEYGDFRKKYDIQFNLLVDNEKQLVKTLAASVTPEAFVLSKGKTIYYGAIDDWAIELGKTKKKATINFVRNAIQGTMANITPVLDYIRPVGCFIE